MIRDNKDLSVAIVDDEEQIARMYELLLIRRQIPVAFIALDGQDALEKFKNTNPRPGIAIIDYRLPSMSGIDLMKEMLTIEPSTRIILISGDDNVMQDSLDAGATAFLKKPAGINEITGTIDAMKRY
jgi:two-component system, chemotaxis family, chemotaxis protein CheY